MPTVRPLRRVLIVLLAFTVFFSAFQKGLELHLAGGPHLGGIDLGFWKWIFCDDHSHASGAVNLALVDLLVWPLFGLALLERLLAWRRASGSLAGTLLPLRREFWLPLPLVAFLGLVCCATLHAASRAGAAVGFVQVLSQWLAAYAAALLLLRGDDAPARRARSLIVRAFLFAAALTILVGLFQYLRLPAEVAGWRAREVVAGLLEHNHQLGLFLALTLPLALALLLADPWRDLAARLALGLLLLLALPLLLAAGTLAALVAGLLAAAALFGERKLAAAAAVLGAALALTLAVAPGGNGRLLYDSARILRDSDRAAAEAPGTLHEDLLAARYKRCQAELKLLRKHPWLGVGPKGLKGPILAEYYTQSEVGKRLKGQTDDHSSWDRTTDEPHSFPMYSMCACETGLLGLGALLWLLASCLARALRAWRSLRAAPRPPLPAEATPETAAAEADRRLGLAVAAGTVGALVAVLVAGAFTSPFTRGLWTALVVLLGLSTAVWETATGRATPEPKAGPSVPASPYYQRALAPDAPPPDAPAKPAADDEGGAP